jgi:hypothetical protein
MYDIFDDPLLPAAGMGSRNATSVCMPLVDVGCMRRWWYRRYVEGTDTITLMSEAQRWVDQLAIAAVAMLEVDAAELARLLPPHELDWLLDLHERLRGENRIFL